MNEIPLFKVGSEINHFLLVDTEGCKIPKLDPFDSSINLYLIRGSELKCDVEKDITYANGRQIFINWSVARKLQPGLQYCKYDVIWRPSNEETNHDFFSFINESKPFTTNVTINNEFIRVRCFDNNNVLLHTNVFSSVHRKLDVEKRCADNYRKQQNNDHLSIMMVGVDSVSRNNMIRYMPKTRDYLLNNMSAIEFLGYNKVADNTFLNIVPMTTGKFVHELPWSSSAVNVSFDRYDFIWYNFSKQGYRTLYSEDAPFGQIFDYQKAGFVKPQADYFDRPFSVAMEGMSDIWNTNHHCVHARPETQIVLDYSKQFIHEFKSSPYFGFTFITRLTHDHIPDTSRADILYTKFLKDINNVLNNTVLIFFSDHGIRFGKVRQTFVGKIEERLPFIFFIFPQWFMKKYPTYYKNLQTNSGRLTTPFDIYETLNHLMSLNHYKEKNTRGMSVLHEVPTNRTCTNAAILPHWCTCSYQKIMPPSDTKIVEVTNKFIMKLNDKIINVKQCETLKLKRVVSASMLVSSDDILMYEKSFHDVNDRYIKFGERVKTYIDYQIMLQTTPGDAMFEGTIRYDEYWKSINMMGDFSRINMYGTTSHCVEGIDLKKICYCKTQLKQNHTDDNSKE